MAPDGAKYTKSEFVSFFGGTREWDHAAPTLGLIASSRTKPGVSAVPLEPSQSAPAPPALGLPPRPRSQLSPAAPLNPWLTCLPLHEPVEHELEELLQLTSDERAANVEAQDDELTAVEAIYERELLIVSTESSAGSIPRPLVLELCVPLADGIEGSLASATGGCIASVRVPPELSRLPSMSGLRCSDDGILSLACLPPLQLRLRRPLSYPSRSPPVIVIRCAWLSDAELDAIATRLHEEVLVPSAGQAVICELVEWLRSSAIARWGPSQLPSPILSLHEPHLDSPRPSTPFSCAQPADRRAPRPNHAARLATDGRHGGGGGSGGRSGGSCLSCGAVASLCTRSALSSVRARTVGSRDSVA